MSHQSFPNTTDTSGVTFQRIAIDPSESLGSFYDVYRDQFLQVSSITFEQTSLELYQRNQCTLSKGDKYHEKTLLELVGVDQQSRFSLLLNLTEAKGIGLLIDYPHIIDEYTRVIHYCYLYEIEKLPDQLHYIQQQLQPAQYPKNATHFVTTVAWGINIVLILQLPHDDKLVGMIDLTLEKYRAYLNGDSSDLKLTKEDIHSHKHIIDTKVYSNMPSATKMTNLHDVFHSISGLKMCVKEYQPLSYTLSPVSSSINAPVEFMDADEFEEYLYETSTMMKTIELFFSVETSNLLSGHFKERLANAHKQWLALKHEYLKLIDHLSKLFIDVRHGKSTFGIINTVIRDNASAALKEDISKLSENVADLDRKGRLLHDLANLNIHYCNVVGRRIDSNDNEETLKRKLIIDETIDRVLCSNDKLNENNIDQLKILQGQLLDERDKNAKLRLTYADFSYSEYPLRDMMILPRMKLEEPNKKLKQRETSPIDMDNVNASASKSDKQSSISPPTSSSKVLNGNYVNILLLGETNVGKSTFINALVNYLTYTTLEKAQSTKPIIPIPVSFSMAAGDDSPEEIIKAGPFDESKNENFQHVGQSITQECRSYVYPMHNKRKTKLRIIDTPGFGDIRGTQQDNDNMQHILDYVKKLSYLNAICIFIKRNATKLKNYYESCLTQLLDFLGPDARHNIIFCFTNSRSTCETPERLAKLLQTRLSSSVLSRIPLKNKNIFYFDSDSFRYLVASETLRFNNEQIKYYEQSWSSSVDETRRFLHYISKKLQRCYIPSKLESVRIAELDIVQMIHPILETTRNILRNVINFKMNPSQVTSNSIPMNKHQRYPCEPEKIEFLDNFKIDNGPLIHIQNEQIHQLSLLCHVVVQFGRFLMHHAGYSHGDPFLEGFLRMIDEESINYENENHNYTNLQLVESLKRLAGSYKQRFDASVKSRKDQNILEDIDQWIQCVQEHPLTSQYTINYNPQYLSDAKKITSM